MSLFRTAIWDEVQLLMKQLICASLNSHRPSGKPNIWLSGSRRSGTTHLMQMIARNRGVKYCFEPMEPIFQHLHDIEVRSLSKPVALLHVYPQIEEVARAHFEEIVQGRSHIREQWRFWRPDFHFFSGRIVFKIIDSMELTEWVEAHVPIRVMYIVRHPISQALSVIRLNWGDRYAPYLTDPSFVQEYLSGASLAACLQIAENGTTLEKHVLTWCCENAPQIRKMRERADWGFIPYETLVTQRREAIEGIARAYDLPDVNKMMSASKEASLTSAGWSSNGTRSAIRAGKDRELIERWRTQVSDEEEASAFKILELFGIDLYKAGQDMCTYSMRLPQS